MDFSRFFNSRDMREHVQKLGYEFNALEAAWLVWQCRSISLEEKHNAYRYIIYNMPDCELNVRYVEHKSLHEYLRDYIKGEDDILAHFRKPEHMTFYIYGHRELSENEYHGFEWSGGPYSTLAKCLKDIYDDNPDEYAVMYSVSKQWLDCDKQSGAIKAIYSREGKLMEITCGIDVPKLGEKYRSLDELFYDVWFKFPTPFAEGDLVCISTTLELRTEPAVLISSPAMSEDEKVLAKCRKSGDISDMCAACYFLFDNPMRIYDDPWYCCLYDLEFYRGELSGKQRVMKALSSLIKGEISAQLYGDACMAVLLESLSESTKYIYDGYYYDEDLEKAGLRKPNK